MHSFFFNKLYVIESLRPEDRKTGKELYEDLLRYQELRFPELKVEYRSVAGKNEWDALMNEIAIDCEQNGSQPILHLEIHGSETKEGLVLENGEYLAYESIRPQIVRINVASRCNLFITLAVCKGLLMIKLNRLTEPMPFCGLLGAYDTILEDDLVIRFNEFYEELFDSFELAKAYKRLSSVNPEMPHSYNFVHADELFCKVYQRYIEQECKEKAVRKRALQAAHEAGHILPDRKARRKHQRAYLAEEKRTRSMFFHRYVRVFFMLDRFPENKERFDVPVDLMDLKQKANIYSINRLYLKAQISKQNIK